MSKKKTSVYCLVLLVLLTMSCVILSVGEAQARYVDTVVWNTYVEPLEDKIEHQFFTEDKSLTVVLGEMDVLGKKNNAWYMVDFTIPGEIGTTGSLTWGQVLEEGEDPALETDMLLGNDSLDQEYPLTIEEDATVLTLVLQNKIRRQEAKTVYVSVTWTQIPGEDDTAEDAKTLTAIFQVILPAEEYTEENPDGEISEVINEEVSGDEPKRVATQTTFQQTLISFEQSNEEATTEPTTEVPTEEETTESTTEAPTEEEITEPTTEAPTEEEITESTTEAPTEEEITESTTEAPTEEEITEPTTEAPTEEEITEPTTEAPTEEETTEPVTEEPSLPQQEINIESLAWFDPAQPLPLWITADNDMTVELGFAYHYDDRLAAEMWPIPRYTRISTDGGKTWLLMYVANTMTLDLESGTTEILLDFSAVEMDTDISRMLLIKGWSADTAPGEASVSVTPMSEFYTAESHVMAANTPLQLTLTEQWPLSTEDAATEYAVTYSVERLTIVESEEEGYRKNYEPVTLIHGGEEDKTAEGEALPTLMAELKEQTLILRTGSTLPPPGTYRINMEWTYKGICIARDQIAFYINYLYDTDSAQTGGAEQ